MRPFYHFGRYIILLRGFLKSPEKFSVYWKLFLIEANSIGVGSVVIVSLVSLFIGAVTAANAAYQLTSPYLSPTLIGATVASSAFMELAPTITSVVLAGKVGSSIASQIGTMRVTEQIDALEVMGINSGSYLIMPKIVAAVVVFPLLITIAAFLQIVGGYFAGIFTGETTAQEYIQGIQTWFDPFQVNFMLLKSVVFGFLISSISSYHGYYTHGGALEVGQSSTKAVVYSIIILLLADYGLAALIL